MPPRYGRDGLRRWMSGWGHPHESLKTPKTKPPAEVGSAGGESGAFAWVAPPWWSGTRCRLRSVSALPRHVRPCLRGSALRTPCAPGRCEKDPSTRQPPVPLPAPCELCRVCRSPQQTPGRVTMRDIRLPFLSSGPASVHRGRNSVGFGHLLWRMVSRRSGDCLRAAISLQSRTPGSAVCRVQDTPPGSIDPFVRRMGAQLQPIELPQLRQR